MIPKGGYTNRILRIDLSKKKEKIVPLNKDLVRKYVGGVGFCAKILWDETGPETDPLGPGNKLIFATGPLTGTIWPASGRFVVVAKSPLNVFGRSVAGGHFGPELKFAGYDMVVIEGRANKPVYLWINDDQVEFKNATHLWGKSTWEADEIIKGDHGDKNIQVASIGQAGENLVKFGSIITSRFRAAARGGLGTVMGAKKLKAVAVRGSKSVTVSNPKKFSRLLKNIKEKIEKDPFTQSIKKYGTTSLVEPMNEIGRFPTRNFQTGVFPMAKKISGDVYVKKYKIRDDACFSCSMACKNFLKIKSGPYAGLCGDHAEYESINSLGARCGVDDPEFILFANWLCDQYGLDTISTGGAISFAMELWEKGIISKKDTGGIDFSWGNKKTISQMIQKIAWKEGFGKILAEGTKNAAAIIGKNADRYAMHVKGLELPAQDGRAQKSMAIAHAAAVRGADHLTHCTFYDEMGFDKIIKMRFGKRYLPQMVDRLAFKYKGIMAKECEDFASMLNSLLLCVTGGTFWPPVLWWRELNDLYDAVTGIRTDVKKFKKNAERTVNLTRAYNIRLGLARKDDTLPERFLKEPAPDGPCKGQVVEQEIMLDEYYTKRGWDIRTGLIPKKKLEELGLKDVASELKRSGKLPGGRA